MSSMKKNFAPALGALPAGALTSARPVAAEDEKKLIAVLQSEAGLKEKMDACRELAVVGSSKAVPALAALLGEEKLSHMARYGMEPIPHPSVDKALRDALGQLKGRPLVGVIGSLGVRLDKKAVDQLVPLLGSEDPDVVAATARTLGRIATPKAAEVLAAKMPGAPQAVAPAMAEGCLACADKLRGEGKKKHAAALCEAVMKAEVPEHVREAAKKAAK